jgi:hypothetical protein
MPTPSGAAVDRDAEQLPAGTAGTAGRRPRRGGCRRPAAMGEPMPARAGPETSTPTGGGSHGSGQGPLRLVRPRPVPCPWSVAARDLPLPAFRGSGARHGAAAGIEPVVAGPGGPSSSAGAEARSVRSAVIREARSYRSEATDGTPIFVTDAPETRYTRSADGTNLAYQVSGDGPLELVFDCASAVPIDLLLEDPGFVRVRRRLDSFSLYPLVRRPGHRHIGG